MTPDQEAEFDLLKLATEHGKFALGVTYAVERTQLALERLQLRDWVRLIDIAFIGAGQGQLCRVFLAQPAAMTWFRKQKAH